MTNYGIGKKLELFTYVVKTGSLSVLGIEYKNEQGKLICEQELDATNITFPYRIQDPNGSGKEYKLVFNVFEHGDMYFLIYDNRIWLEFSPDRELRKMMDLHSARILWNDLQSMGFQCYNELGNVMGVE